MEPRHSHGRRSRLAIAAASILLLVGCTGGETPTGESIGDPSSRPTTTAEVPTTTPAEVPTTLVPAGSPVAPAGENEITVHAPDEIGPHPVIVTVHGGGWVGGDPADMAALADDLSRWAVVFNVTYRGMSEGGRFPGMVEDVACAVVAAAEQAPRYTSTPDDIYLVAHSAGAHLSALVALAPDVFTCSGSVPDVDGFVGLAGPYDVTRIPLLSTFFGATLEDAPETWAVGNPATYASTEPGVRVLLLHGTADQVVPTTFSEDLETTLAAAGGDVELVELPGVDHRQVRDPLVVSNLVEAFVLD